MKLIVTADDYAISNAVTDGICKCAREGCLTETGLFSNMDGAEYAVKRIKEYPHIALGEDINLVAGRPVSDPKEIPTLVQPNGMFIDSGTHKEMDKINKHHICYEDAYRETKNQVRRFIELYGDKPAYIGGHAYGSDETNKALEDVASEYEIPVSMKIFEKFGLASLNEMSIYFNFKKNENGNFEFGETEQLHSDPIKAFREGKFKYLEEALANNGVAHMHTHAGFVDRDLCRRSTWTMIRMMEADFLCSEELNSWIKENNVELISIRDLR